MKKHFRKFLNRSYIPRKLVFATDVTLTLMCLVPAYLLRFNFNAGQINLDELLQQQLFVILPVYVAVYLLTGSYRGIIRHSGIEDASRFAVAISLAGLVVLMLTGLFREFAVLAPLNLPYSVVIIHATLVALVLPGYRLGVRNVYYNFGVSREGRRQVYVFGGGELGKLTRRVLENDHTTHMKVVGFIDDDTALIGKRLADKLIYSEDQAFLKIRKGENISEIVMAVSPGLMTKERKTELVDRCLKHGVSIREVPPIKDWINGQLNARQIKAVKIEDLLGRDPIMLDQQKVAEGLKESVVLVTGAAGSIGSEIVRQLLKFACRQVILVDQAESGLYDIQQELKKQYETGRFEVVVASVHDKSHMRRVFETYRPQYVFHAAAYKHVPLMEMYPCEAVRVNVGGTRLVANLSVEFEVSKFVMISTDKAVNPTNVMGASKRICEIYIQSLAQSGRTKTQFITTRFGNVLGSNGSVVPLFRKQIEAGGPVTITHKDIIRYFMTIPEACQLVLEAGFMGHGGEIYVFDMGQPVKIYDLAVRMISLAGLKPGKDIPIEITGLRPGEKLYEELLADEENTIATHHPKIKAARVRSHDFEQVKMATEELLKALQTETDGKLVCRMKAMVPEFISQNSKYSRYDEPMNDHFRMRYGDSEEAIGMQALDENQALREALKAAGIV